jgi:hypothetical protein
VQVISGAKEDVSAQAQRVLWRSHDRRIATLCLRRGGEESYGPTKTGPSVQVRSDVQPCLQGNDLAHTGD